MDRIKQYTPFGVLIVLALILQIVLIALDCSQGYLATAEKFVRNYYYLNASMQDQLCSELAADGVVVENYLNKKYAEAARRGLSPNYLRQLFIEMHLKTVDCTETTAKVRIEGETRVAINPAIMIIGKVFRIGKTYPVEVTLDLIKEEDRWRVCGTPLKLNS